VAQRRSSDNLPGVRVFIYGIDTVATPQRLLFMQRENPQRVLDV
jgi:hypothetical protein